MLVSCAIVAVFMNTRNGPWFCSKNNGLHCGHMSGYHRLLNMVLKPVEDLSDEEPAPKAGTVEPKAKPSPKPKPKAKGKGPRKAAPKQKQHAPEKQDEKPEFPCGGPVLKRPASNKRPAASSSPKDEPKRAKIGICRYKNGTFGYKINGPQKMLATDRH